MGTAVIVEAGTPLRSRRHSEREHDVVLRLPVRLCTSTCIPQVNSAAIRIGTFAFKNSNRQCKNHEGGKLSPRKLQGRYMAALSRIAGAPMCGNAKRHTPIFQPRTSNWGKTSHSRCRQCLDRPLENPRTD